MKKLKKLFSKINSWFKTSAGKLTVLLLFFCLVLLGISFLPIFKTSSHLRDNFENIIIGIGTNIFGIIITVSFVQFILDKQNEKEERIAEKEKIIRFYQIMSFRIEKYFQVFAQITTPLSVFSQQQDKYINPDFKFEDMQDLYFPCLLIVKSQHSAISVFYSEERRIKNYMLKMLENIDFKYYPHIQNLLIAFVKQSEANDVRQAILDYETKVVYGKPLSKIISSQIATNNVDDWVGQFESGKLESNIINNFVILYRLLQKEFFLLNELIKQVKEIEGKDDFVAKVDEWGD